MHFFVIAGTEPLNITQNVNFAVKKQCGKDFRYCLWSDDFHMVRSFTVLRRLFACCQQCGRLTGGVFKVHVF